MKMIHKDLLPKLKGGHESHGKPPLFHLAILPLTFWPASLFLWQAGIYSYLNRHRPLITFLLAWLLPTWLFFEIMPTKLPQYVLPTFPVIAWLAAMAITDTPDHPLPSRWVRCLQAGWLALSIGFAFAIAGLPWLVNGQLHWAGLLFLIFVSFFSSWAVYHVWHGRYQHALPAVFLLAIVSYPLLFGKLLPDMRPLWLSKSIANAVNQKQLSGQNPLLVAGIYQEPSLVFYLNTSNVKFTDINTLKTTLANRPQTMALIDGDSAGKGLEYLNDFIVLSRTTGFNYSKGKWIELLLLTGHVKQTNGRGK